MRNPPYEAGFSLFGTLAEVNKAAKTSNSTPKCMWILERGELRSKSNHLAQQAILNFSVSRSGLFSDLYSRMNRQSPKPVV